jgi:hypothetical protein
MSTDYTMYAYWVTQKPPMAVKVAMAKEAIKQGITKDVFMNKNTEKVRNDADWDSQATDWHYAYELAEEDLRESTEG